MAEDSDIIQKIERDERNDCRRNTNKRKMSDEEEMWDWLINSDDQNQEQGEETSSKHDIDDEIEAMFDKVKRRKKTEEKNPQPVGLLVEKVMALLEIAAEEDIELNRQNKPAIKKIQTLPLLTEFLSKKHLQQEFLDRGVLSLLKIWLEPLPDGSLPNTTVRASLLNILTHAFPIDISLEHPRELLKKSGLGKVVMFLSKSAEEITANRQLAKDLIQNWSRIIFHKGTRFSDLRKSEEKAVIPLNKTSPPVKKQSTMQLVEADLDFELPPKQSCSSSRSGVSVPEAAARAYAVVPRTKSNPEGEVERARVRYIAQRDCKNYQRIEKKLRRMKNSNKKKTVNMRFNYL